MAIALANRKEISPARLAAFNVLQQVETGAFSSILLAAEEPQLQPADRALCHELVLGVLRRRLQLDKTAEHYSKRRFESLDPAVRIALRLGLYQLRFLTRIPASAAVNESVSLVRRARLSSATGFVNALLRRAIREPNYDPVTEASDPLERISLDTSHPRWLVERWARAFGVEEAEAFAAANNMVPPTAFRVVRNRAGQDDVLARLSSAGAVLESSQVAEAAWRVAGATSLVRELSTQGQIYLQDEASQRVAEIIDVRRGELALDLCAAPGGKTTLMADRAGDGARIIASDRSATRLATVIATSRLHGLTSIKPLLVDAGEKLPFEAGVFDRVLIDAPCSGTGTLRRNPEIRWRLSAGDIGEFALKQKRFLVNAAAVVKGGGRLVYSTCSVEREENEEVVEEFLAQETSFELEMTERTWPHREGSDGFFIAVLKHRPSQQNRAR